MRKSSLAIAAFLATAMAQGGPALRAAAMPAPPKKRRVLTPLRHPEETQAQWKERAEWNEQVELKKEFRQQQRAERRAGK